MKIYHSMRACSRRSSRPGSFVFLSDEKSPHGTSQSPSDGDLFSKWDEKKEIRINTWADSFKLENDSPILEKKPKTIRSRLHPCSHNYLARKIKSRIVNTRCLKRTRSAESPGPRTLCPVRSVTRQAASRAKVYISEVSKKITSHRSEISHSEKKPPSIIDKNYNCSSTDGDIVDESEVCATRRARKPRKVTRYYATPQPSRNYGYRANITAYHSTPTLHTVRSAAACSGKLSFHEPRAVQKPVGRHLEWLKFLA